jgi:general stress protein YciG
MDEEKQSNTYYDRIVREQGKAAADAIMKNIASKGGKKPTRGGFGANPELARVAGRKGGKKSRRGKKQ